MPRNLDRACTGGVPRRAARRAAMCSQHPGPDEPLRDGDAAGAHLRAAGSRTASAVAIVACVGNLLQLLPGLGTVLLALFGGVLGSMLLEVWWKPWRARRRVAALLVEEVNLNAQILKLQTHLRQRDPGRIPRDFQLSRIGFEAIAQEIGELPANVAGRVILTYHRFDHLRRLREIFGERYQRWREAAAAGRDETKKLRRSTLNALDTFNVMLDKALKEAG